MKRNKEQMKKLVDIISRLSAKGMCSREIENATGIHRKHVQYVCKRFGIPHPKQGGAVGKWNGNFHGGKTIDKNGYVLVRVPDGYKGSRSNKYMLEHRLVMEQILGRSLLPDEVVHHKDGNPQNNSPDNLELFCDNGTHLAATLEGHVPRWTPEGVRHMADALHWTKETLERLQQAYTRQTTV